MQYASLPGFLRMILILILIYYVFKILSRLFAPALMRYVTKKAGQRFGQQFNTHTQSGANKAKKEGEISIDKIPRSKKDTNNNVGEYVDYEEID